MQKTITINAKGEKIKTSIIENAYKQERIKSHKLLLQISKSKSFISSFLS